MRRVGAVSASDLCVRSVRLFEPKVARRAVPSFPKKSFVDERTS